jgi:hypothetical protein
MGSSRRQFIVKLAAAGAVLLGAPHRLLALSRRSGGPHPTPRAGITAAKVLTKEQLAESPKAISVFDAVREIPEIIDGIRCNCGCAESPGFYSLLTCFEGETAMAKTCGVCQGQGRLAARLHKEGKTLDQIRAAIDAKFG